MATATRDPITHLTPREMQVARAIAVGMINVEIAEMCKISVKTYDTHRAHVMKLLGLRNNVELARHALRCGWVEL